LANPNADRLILVTGATGKQGGAVVRHLRARGFPVRAITRDVTKPGARALVGEGAEVIAGNMDDMDSLRRAMDGAWGAFSVQTPFEEGLDAEVRQGIAVADAAKRARISHFVYASVGGADRNTGIPHFESKNKIEQHIRPLGVPYTILRPVFFMENWLGMKDSIKQGVLAQPLSPDRKLEMIAVDDIGAFAALAFEHTGHWRDRTFELAGDSLSMTDIAQKFGQKLGREITYQQVPWDQFEKRAGHEITVMYRWFEEHGYNTDIGAVRAEYGRLTSFAKWLNGVTL
jgi:uncharacterized protein YbjT (DUF2867 family)